MSGITVTEFARVQKEVLKLKSENHALTEQLQKISNTPQTFLQSFFSTAESTEIERLQREEAELKQSLHSMQEHIDSMREQIRESNNSDNITTQIATLEALFKTKKRELMRMYELNATTLADLEEEVELSRGLCESLESGRASLARDKEALDNTILSLQAAHQSIESRIHDLEQLNQQLKADLGVKAADGNEYADLAEQIEEARKRLEATESEYSAMRQKFDAKESQLLETEQKKKKECDALDEVNQSQASKVEEQLKALRSELQSLKTRNRTEETVEIDVDSLVKENAALQARIDDLDKKKAELASVVTENQIDCSFLGQWMKTAQNSHTDADSVFKDLIQRECQAKEELRKLEAAARK